MKNMLKSCFLFFNSTLLYFYNSSFVKKREKKEKAASARRHGKLPGWSPRRVVIKSYIYIYIFILAFLLHLLFHARIWIHLYIITFSGYSNKYGLDHRLDKITFPRLYFRHASIDIWLVCWMSSSISTFCPLLNSVTLIYLL
jgi:hypothetical protein